MHPVNINKNHAVHDFADAARHLFKNVAKANTVGTDADGGYTVPDDIRTEINRYREERFSLQSLVDTEPVTTSSGRRTYQSRANHTGFKQVAEGGKIENVAGPTFEVIEYAIKKYAGWMPVTSELLADSDANITNTLIEWLGEEDIATRNRLILALMQNGSASELANLDGIKEAINVTLGSAFKNSSRIITNDDGLNWLDTLKDSNGHYLLKPSMDPASPIKQQLAVGATNTVANTITPFVEKVTGLLDKFNNMDEAQQKQIIKWAAMAAAIGPGLIAFGKMISTIGRVGMGVNKFIGIASKAAGGFKELHTGAGLAKAAIAAITSPVGIVLGVIAALAIAVIAIKTHFDTFKAGLSGASPAFEKISANFRKIKDALQPFIDKVMEAAQVVMDVFGNVIAGACGAAVSFFAGAFAGITQYITGLIDVFQGIITFIAGAFSGDWEKAWSGVKQIFGGIVDEIMGIISTVTGAIGGIINGVQAILGMDSGSEKATSTKKVSGRAIGDRSWRGGLVQVHERGGEILDLPQGTRIYPHDVSMQMAKAGQGQSVNVAKLADQIVVREDADIQRIAEELVRRIRAAGGNMGGVPVADMA